MSTKTQSVSRSMQRVQRNSVAAGNNENTVANLPNGHSQDVLARISERAYALYEEHGREDGRALEDWLEAERQVLL
ncbi:MAG TPA: DUF2934 domain-containing protein [Nitrospiraceae bacterium]|nr:DUF2934 domain-containing protein [Nitrospiraceae bacterium]